VSFDTILIANRGEIACRVIRTARRMGYRTVAVYSDADAGAQHVAQADAAVRLGPPPARESYLRIEALIAAAKATGAGAIHPGYGFLSERAEFAEACAAAGLVFIGPPAQAIRAMGDKSAAKALMEAAKVPVVPGYHGAAQDERTLAEAASRIGFPALIKAAAGGGGKGMRVVAAASELAEAVASAKREAAASFGDDRVLIERYLERPRHIEVQVFADAQGNAVYLFERDCSIQRRHQKVVEEAPAPGMTAQRRQAMGEAAVAAARAVGYVGAGTVEFIADADGAFYFMEMNTRLQVEHPVTEMITGLDLVDWQIRVARGEALPRRQAELAIGGHAIEVRICAEDPARDFLPATGRLDHLRFPPAGAALRVDTGVVAGDAVSIHYDSMIAKLIVHAEDRAGAVRRLRQALAETEIAGVTTNLALLGRIAAHPAFAAGAVDTGFIPRHRAELLPEAGGPSAEATALAVLALLLERQAASRAAARGTADPWSPWAHGNGWRLNDDGHAVLRLRQGAEEVSVTAHYRRGGRFSIEAPGGTVEAAGSLDADGLLVAVLDGVRRAVRIVRHAGGVTVILAGVSHRFALTDPVAEAGSTETAEGALTAPMPGKIIAVRVAEGAAVQRGQPLVVLEAMKMEHAITAPGDGVVEAVRCAVGDQVAEGAELVRLKAAEAKA